MHNNLIFDLGAMCNLLDCQLRLVSDCAVFALLELYSICSAYYCRYEEDETSPGVCDHLNAGLYSYTILSRSFAVPRAVHQTVPQ